MRGSRVVTLFCFNDDFEKSIFNFLQYIEMNVKCSRYKSEHEIGQTTAPFGRVTSAQHWPVGVLQSMGPRHIICAVAPEIR